MSRGPGGLVRVGLRARFEAEPEQIVNVLGRAVRGRHIEAAARVLSRVWLIAPVDTDARWCRALHDHAVSMAALLPQSLVLAQAFRHGAEFFRARAEYRMAVAQGVHELAIRRGLPDLDAIEATLTLLAANYRAQGRMHRVIGCAEHALETRIAAGDRLGVARLLGCLGRLMAEVDRPGDAFNYLERAKALCEGLTDAAGRLRWRVEIGRLLWSSGDEFAARRYLRRTLLLGEEADEESAAHLRTLLEAPSGAVPDSPWPAFGETGRSCRRHDCSSASPTYRL